MYVRASVKTGAMGAIAPIDFEEDSLLLLIDFRQSYSIILILRVNERTMWKIAPIGLKP